MHCCPRKATEPIVGLRVRPDELGTCLPRGDFIRGNPDTTMPGRELAACATLVPDAADILGTMGVTGFITAGGRSSRMGRDKAWLMLDGRPMIEHVVSALSPAADTVAIIANDDEYKKLGRPVFADSAAGIGPLEAIRIALANSKTERVLLVGCDMPFV